MLFKGRKVASLEMEQNKQERVQEPDHVKPFEGWGGGSMYFKCQWGAAEGF